MCKKSRIRLLLTALLLAFTAFPAPAATVLELYTSQGCPSCPRADRLVEDLSKQTGVITLTCHVTYFDRRGWTDPLSIIPCDARQLAYREAGIAPKIFTPLAVVNGKKYVIGSHEDELRQALQSSASVPTIVLRNTGGYLDIALPQVTLKKPAAIWIFAIDDLHAMQIGGGANRGKTINYVNAVRRMAKLMNWDGKPVKMAMPLSGVSADSFIVLAQYTDGSDIIAAGKTP